MSILDQINPTVRAIPPSGIRKFFEILDQMPEAISLGIGEPDFITPWHIREAGIRSLENGHTYYTSNWGLPRLRTSICNYMKRRFDLSYEENQVVVTVGGSEAIDACIRVLCQPGDEVLIPEPSFVCYRPCALLAGAVPKVLETREEDEFRLTPEILEKAITDKTKLLVLPYPNNPTGAIMEREDLEKIVAILKDKNIFVLSDEIYAELTYRGKHVSIASFPEMYERTVVVSGFSKAYAMTGWRLGFACGHPDIIQMMVKVHQFGIMSAPTTSQYAAIEALDNGDEDIERMKKEYNLRRHMIVDGFREMGLPVFEPLGAFYAFPCIKSLGISSNDFCTQLLQEEQVAVIPGNAFGESGEGFVRCSYATATDSIHVALRRIKRFVEKKRSEG